MRNERNYTVVNESSTLKQRLEADRIRDDFGVPILTSPASCSRFSLAVMVEQFLSKVVIQYQPSFVDFKCE